MFTVRNEERGIASQAPKDAESARAVLLELIDGRVERLEDLLKRHQERDEAAGVDRYGFDDTKEGEQLRSYQLGGNRALMRIIDTFLKYRREKGRAAAGEGDQRSGRADEAGRREDRRGQPPDRPRGMTEVIAPSPKASRHESTSRPPPPTPIRPRSRRLHPRSRPRRR